MLNSSPLPPRGIFVPTSMLFHSELPSSVLVTWIQLRALAWQGWSTPPLSLAEFASLLGIHPSRLQKHLDHLQSVSALSLHEHGSGKIVISFPAHPGRAPGFHTSEPGRAAAALQPTQDRSTHELASYFPHQILGYLTFPDELEPPLETHQSAQVTDEARQASLSLDHIRPLIYQEVT